MSIFDAFKPKWQNSNPAKRIEAIADLDELTCQDIIERVALSDDNVEVRMAAVKKLAIIKTLQDISTKDNDAGVRRLAESRAFEEIVKKLKNFNESALNSEVLGYIEAIKDTRYTEDVLKATDNVNLKRELVKQCSKQSLLAQIATRDSSEEIALQAADRVTSESLQADLIKSSKHTSVRKKISDKVRAKKEAEDNGRKAAELLQSKREALIKQAHFLAAQKDAFATKPQFDDLMNEANALGMGESTATLNEIYESFNKFYDEANAAKKAAENAEAEKQAKIVRLTESLTELEGLLEAGTTEENADRVNAIIQEWNEGKSVMDAALIKRFNNAYFKSQEAKKIEIPSAESENASEEEIAIRKSLLERLQALSETEIDENTGKHLHAIVREWEKLALLEGDDPILQAYNALRTKLNELISAFNEKAQKVIEENQRKDPEGHRRKFQEAPRPHRTHPEHRREPGIPRNPQNSPRHLSGMEGNRRRTEVQVPRPLAGIQDCHLPFPGNAAVGKLAQRKGPRHHHRRNGRALQGNAEPGRACQVPRTLRQVA